MKLIDLSGEIFHKCPTLPNHPPAVITDWNTHDTFREAEGVKFSIASKYMSFGEHTGSHVDAPVHFDADPNALSVDKMPLEDFYTEAVCLDLSHKEPKSDITVHDLENLLADPARAEDPVVRFLVTIFEAVHDVIPEVPAIVVENGIGSASGEFDRVEQEFEMSRNVHGASVCCSLNRKTIEAIFLFSWASSL